MVEHKYPVGSDEWVAKNKVELQYGMHVKQCGWSKNWRPVAEFSLNPQTGLYLFVCEANKKALRASQAKHKKTPKGKAIEKRYNTGAAGKAKEKRHRTGAAGKAWSERANAAKRRRTIEDRAWALDNAILCASYKLISRLIATSPTFTRRTGWHHKAFLEHVLMRVHQGGHDWDNHGNSPGQWNLEHRIPRSAYNFRDPEDVKRCWASDNVDVKSFEENMAKDDALLPEEIRLVKPEHWPKAWNGVMPDDSKRLDIWKLASARKIAEATMEAEELDDFEDLDETAPLAKKAKAGPSMEDSSSYASEEDSD